MRHKTLVAMAVAVVLLAAACGSSSKSGSGSSATTAAGSSSATSAAGGASSTPAASSSSPYRILAVVGLTGVAAVPQQAIVQGIKAGVAYANAHGGILGHQISLTVEDDQGDPTKAATEVQDALASSTPPNAVMPGVTAVESAAVAPIIQRAGILGLGEVQPSQTYPLFFASAASQQNPANSLVQWLQGKGVKKLALLYSQDPYGEASNADTIAAAKKVGMQTESVGYSDTALDLTPELQNLQSGNPDYLWIQSLGAQGPRALTDRATLGWKVPVIADISLSAEPLTKLDTPAALDGVTMQILRVQQYIAPAQQPSNLSTMINYLQQIGPINLPIDISSLMYDLVVLDQLGAKQANSISATAIASALENLKTPAPPPPPWVTYACYCYTHSIHTANSQPSDYLYVPPGPLVDGMVQG
jgi:branched-chain amino acid transport system substrate-binding protein